MHVQVTKVATDWRHVLRSREPSKALMVYENPQRRDRCEQNVDPQIKFKPINEVGLVKVALGNVVLIWLKPVVVASEEDAFSLTTVFGFNNKCLGPTFVKLLLELLYVARQNPRIRKEIVILREVLLHSKQVARKQILAGHRMHTWEVVRALVVLHFRQQRWQDWTIDEPNVPVLVIGVAARSQVAIGSHLVDHLILRVADVELKLWVVVGLSLCCGIRAESTEGLIRACHFLFLGFPHVDDCGRAAGFLALGLFGIACLRVSFAA